MSKIQLPSRYSAFELFYDDRAKIGFQLVLVYNGQRVGFFGSTQRVKEAIYARQP